MKLAICIITHHKPYLLKNSIISLNSQKFNDYELNIIFNKGNGKSNNYYFRDYNSINKKNPYLTNSSNAIIKTLKKINCKYKFYIFKNDHGLDSGAWYKFIYKKLWINYDYCIFLMEGFLFKNKNILSDINFFLKKKRPDFTMLGSELIFHPKKNFYKGLSYKQFKKNYNLISLHQFFFDKIFNIFCKIKKFNYLFKKWDKAKIFDVKSNKTDNIAINFFDKKYFSIYEKSKLLLKYIIKEKKFFNFFTALLLFNKGNFRYLLPINFFFSPIFKTKYSSAYLVNSPYLFVNQCQHILSKKFIKKFDLTIRKYKLMRIFKFPFSASPLELIWGFLPKCLGFKKFYYDGIHRPRKHFLNYTREDDVSNMSKYLKLYNKK
jgi:hypothetical protein